MSRLKVVSLFSGLGGIDYGLEAAGFKTVFATDFDIDCCTTIATNRDWHVECADIHDVTSNEIFEFGGLDEGECSLLVGGPPCQPFSKSGFGSETQPKGLKDKRSNTIAEFFRIAAELEPRVFMIENVPQFASDVQVQRYLARKTAELNLITRSKYKLNFIKLNCADYGIPQLRRRVFIVASRDGSTFNAPLSTHAESAIPRLGIKKHKSTWDALSRISISKQEKELLRVGGRWGELLDSIPAGENYLWHTRRGGGRPIFKWRSRFWHFLLKLHPEQPSWTIPARPGAHTGPFHWDNRRLAVDELAALQTLPKEIKIYGSITSAKKQIGNAVPSAIAELLGHEIRRQLLDSKSRMRTAMVPTRATKRLPSVEL